MNDTPIGVLLGADSLPGARSGIGRQTLEVARLLRRTPAIGALALLVGERCLPADALETLARMATPATTRGVSRIAAVIPGVAAVHAAWRRRQMNGFAASMGQRIGGRVVYHEVNMIARPFDGATVVTVHDLSWRADPRWHTAERTAWIERRLPSTLAQASRFVCVSDFTAGDVRREFGVAPSRIDIVRPAASAMFRPIEREPAAPVLSRLELTDRGYVFAVSTIEPRKNFDRLLAAHAMLPEAVRQRLPLVIAGSRGWGAALTDAVAERAIRTGTLRLLGHVADDDLVALYARSAAVAYVSLYEGFGLPVLEAMACGAPVIASRNTAVGETAGDAALLVDPEDVADIANAIARVLNDPSLAAALTARGLLRAAEFSWDAMAAGLIASWRKALDLSDHEPGGHAQQAPE
jgi:O-antigen biosynthesis alpha-1,3-rhamnosyltransferase